SQCLNTSAIMGFMNSLMDVIKRERPDHLAVAFDKDGSVDRAEMFAAYKANRDETPEAIQIAIPYIKNILTAMHIPCIEKPGYEADDIIGTLAKQAEKQGYKVYMVTPDKDFAQLVSENIFMYKPSRMGNGIEIWGIPEVQAKFGVKDPEQVIDFLGMMGDSVDNIPGFPGVGEKTAKKFLEEFGSIENLVANTHLLKGKMKEKIEANVEQGLLSKKLARIMLDVPVEFHEENFELNTPDTEKVKQLFKELEFRRMLDNFLKVFGEEPEQVRVTNEPKEVKKKVSITTNIQFDLFNAPGSGITVTEEVSINGYKTLQNTPHSYQYINTALGRKLLLEKLLKQKTVCFDTETTNIKSLEAELVGCAFSWEVGKG